MESGRASFGVSDLKPPNVPAPGVEAPWPRPVNSLLSASAHRWVQSAMPGVGVIGVTEPAAGKCDPDGGVGVATSFAPKVFTPRTRYE